MACLAYCASFEPQTLFKWDAFNRIPCAEELARIDNYERELSKQKDDLAVVVIYGGRRGTREGEVVARLFAIRDRLITRNPIDRNRILILDGGFRDKFEIQFWIVESLSREAAPFLIYSELSLKEVQLLTPAIRKWEYNCAGKLR